MKHGIPAPWPPSSGGAGRTPAAPERTPTLDTRRRAGLRRGLALAALAWQLPAARAADTTWPQRPIRLIVPYPPGGPLDLAARALADAMRADLGQPVLVENKPGAGGNIGADLVAKAEADGHTLLIGAVATHAINPYLYASMPYDANRDFTPITRVAVVPNVLVMTPATMARLGIHDVRDLVAYAKSHPGRLTFGSGGNGSAGHLAGELLKTLAGISMVHIPYKGAAQAKTDLIAGQTDLMFDNLASAMPQIKTDQLKALAVTTRERDPIAAEIPTMIESGIKGFDINTWFGLFGPAGLPPAVRDRLQRSASDALRGSTVTQALARLGAAPAPMAPAAFADYIRAEQAKYEKLVKASGATVD